MATNHHGNRASHLGCSCYINNSSDIVWQWPLDNCHDALPPESGRKIIRRLAYRAGIREISNEAFILAEAELLHTLGLLLVDAYESSIELAKDVSYLDEDREITYNQPSGLFDIFKKPPPPFWKVDKEYDYIYTIVPGQIMTAAKQRGIGPYVVFGNIWVPTSGFSLKKEMEIECSYYYKSRQYNDVEDDEQAEMNIGDDRKNVESEAAVAPNNYDDDNGEGSVMSYLEGSVMSSEGSFVPSEGSVMFMPSEGSVMSSEDDRSLASYFSEESFKVEMIDEHHRFLSWNI